MAKQSAGILPYRKRAKLEVLLVHPGGPYWAKKDEGAWSIPKGEYEEGEDPLAAARRELEEETGITLSGVELIDLGSVTQKGGKTVRAWAASLDLDPRDFRSNAFKIEWPPRSGKLQEFPEVDRAEWLELDRAREKINPAQEPFLERLGEHLKA